MASVRILYFAKVRDAVGIAEEQRDLPEDVATVADLADLLAADWPVFADRARLRAAVDQVMAKFDTAIGDAREIAFFPPVTGG
ncbi:MAG: molybdopterin converting factor subunit 1 [Sphingomonadales bacterium]